jgi:hypothetical protein
MKLENYQFLIQNLPVNQQSFITKHQNWKNAEQPIIWLKDLNDQIFNDQTSISISREELLNHTGSITEGIVKIIYWGYPNGMRGNNFVNILKKLPVLEIAFERLMKNGSPISSDYKDALLAFDDVPGLGMSTFSKILYFLNIHFNDYPSLILDKRIIDVFRNRIFSDFDKLTKIRYENTRTYYLSYLEIMHQIASNMETKAENIEMFLFTFGNNLKSTDNNN